MQKNSEIKNIIKGFSEDSQKILKDNLVAEYLFGSYARNESDEFSDIDILIIVKHFDYQIRRKLSQLSSEYSINHGVYISTIVKDARIWERNKFHKTLFFQEVQRDGVQIC